MYPVLLQLGSLRLHTYGIVVLAAIVIALWVAGLEARRKRLDPEFLSDLGVAVIPAGFVGARPPNVPPRPDKKSVTTGPRRPGRHFVGSRARDSRSLDA